MPLKTSMMSIYCLILFREQILLYCQGSCFLDARKCNCAVSRWLYSEQSESLAQWPDTRGTQGNRRHRPRNSWFAHAWNEQFGFIEGKIHLRRETPAASAWTVASYTCASAGLGIFAAAKRFFLRNCGAVVCIGSQNDEQIGFAALSSAPWVARYDHVKVEWNGFNLSSFSAVSLPRTQPVSVGHHKLRPSVGLVFNLASNNDTIVRKHKRTGRYAVTG